MAIAGSPRLSPTESEAGGLLLGSALVAAVLPIAARSLRLAAWYWVLVAGPIAAALLRWATPSLNGLVAAVSAIAVWILPVVALRILSRPRAGGFLAGERWATQGDLRVHQLQAWPDPSPQISAGTSWPPAQPRTVRPVVYGVDGVKEGRHTLLVVPTGLGKGLWTTTQLLTWKGSAIVNDLKGDTYPHTAGWRTTLGPVYVLSTAAPVHRFDPTAAAQTEDDLRPLAHAVCTDPQDRDPYWAQYAARILLALMLAGKQTRQPVFPFVARAVRGGASRALAMVAEIDPSLADRVRPQGDSRGFTSAWETLATRCESILSPHALAMLSSSDFSAADLLTRPATLYLQVPEARLDDLRPFLRLVWTSLIMQLITISDLSGAAHQPLLLVLDEAGRTPFASLPDFLVTLRSRRISCAVLVQALSQLRAAYGQQADTILGNCSVHVYARSEDLATAEYVSARIGMAEEILPTVSRTVHRGGASTTRGHLRRFRPLLSPQQFRTLKDHQILAFLPACPPAPLARMDWRQHPDLVRRAQLPASALTYLETIPPSALPHDSHEYIEPD